jgi:hypothetical protein
MTAQLQAGKHQHPDEAPGHLSMESWLLRKMTWQKKQTKKRTKQSSPASQHRLENAAQMPTS